MRLISRKHLQRLVDGEAACIGIGAGNEQRGIGEFLQRSNDFVDLCIDRLACVRFGMLGKQDDR